MLSDLIPHRCCVYNLYYILVSVFHCFVGNVRKAMTIVLSFCLFPKPFSYLYIVGGMLVFGSLIGTEITKEHMKKDKKMRTIIWMKVNQEELYFHRSIQNSYEAVVVYKAALW